MAWRSPTFKSASHNQVTLSDVSAAGLELRYPANYVPGLDCAANTTVGKCAWATVSGTITDHGHASDFSTNATAATRELSSRHAHHAFKRLAKSTLRQTSARPLAGHDHAGRSHALPRVRCSTGR